MDVLSTLKKEGFEVTLLDVHENGIVRLDDHLNVREVRERIDGRAHDRECAPEGKEKRKEEDEKAVFLPMP